MAVRATLPCMADPISFRFLWKQDHLSDYSLQICSQPEDEQTTPTQQQQHAAATATPEGDGTETPSVLLQGSFPDAGQLTHCHEPQLQDAALDTGATPAAPAAAADAAPAAAAEQEWHWQGDAQPAIEQQQQQAGIAGRQTRSSKRQRAAAAAAATAKTPAAAAAASRHRHKASKAHKSHSPAAATAATAAAGGSIAERAAAAAALAGMGSRSIADMAAESHHGEDEICADGAAAAAAAAAASGPAAAGPAAAAARRSQAAMLQGDLPVKAEGETGGSSSRRQQQQQRAIAPLALLSPRSAAGTPMPAAAVAAAAEGAAAAGPVPPGSSSGCPAQPVSPSAAAAAAAAAGTAADGSAAGPSPPAGLVVHRQIPVHGAVLSAVSEYFRALIANWQQGQGRLLQMVVAPEEASVAEALVEFMYTGELPSMSQDDVLSLMRLSDRFQVRNCPTACARRFSDTPMEELSLETVCAIFEWPGFLQEAEAFAGVSAKAWSKLLEVFGDLEAAWRDVTRRQQFLELPHRAVLKLLASDQVAVISENTILVALCGWVEAASRREAASHAAAGGCGSSAAAAAAGAGSGGGGSSSPAADAAAGAGVAFLGPGAAAAAATAAATAAAFAAAVAGGGGGGSGGLLLAAGRGSQQPPAAAYKDLAELVRLQHLSPAFLGSVLQPLRLPVLAGVANAESLMAVARYASANEASRAKLQNMPNRNPHMKVLFSPPRARSAAAALQFEWVMELSTIQSMIAQFRNTKVTVDRYSEPHFFNGFHWQLVIQVLAPPAKPPNSNQSSAPTVDVFVGTTARIQIGGSTLLPDVLYFRGEMAAREVASGDFSFVNRMDSGFVCGTAGWGFRNFLRITDWGSEAQLRRFFYDGKLHLRCSIDHCE